MRRTLRVLGVGWLLHVKLATTSAFNGILSVLYPLFFATVAFFMFDESALLYASLGAAVMGIWGATSTAAGAAMQHERRQGTLELLVSAPVPFALVLLPITVALATMGVYSMVATLLWGRLLFGIELTIEQPLAFAVAIPATIVTIGALGFLFAVSFVRYRRAWALGNLFEYPVWLICGFLVPIALLPDWVRPISWALAPTWGMNAIRDAALGGNPWPDLAAAGALGAAYVLLGLLVLERMLDAARARAVLALT